ncbi:MAG: hypothetical protein MZV70_54735 [Desulfobacterales bacterium]|nr:hypothetical protein [Desulfobacterales bacterium]
MEACLDLRLGRRVLRPQRTGAVHHAGGNAGNPADRRRQRAWCCSRATPRDIVNICCCCGDCCQVLLHLKRHPKPALAVASPFMAAL